MFEHVFNLLWNLVFLCRRDMTNYCVNLFFSRINAFANHVWCHILLSFVSKEMACGVFFVYLIGISQKLILTFHVNLCRLFWNVEFFCKKYQTSPLYDRYRKISFEPKILAQKDDSHKLNFRDPLNDDVLSPTRKGTSC